VKAKKQSREITRGWFGRFNALKAKVLLSTKMHPRHLLVLKVAVVFGLLLGISWYRLDPDFGWHLAAGNYIRAHGIPAHDIFTYTARNFPWIDHEWGNDVIVSWLYQLGGYFVLCILYAALWASALFVNGRRSLKVLSLAAVAFLPYAGIRPIAWTVLGFALLLRFTSDKSRFPKLAIPLIFIIWANLHGGFVIGLVYLAYLAIARRSRSWGLILLLSIFATFINVYGPRLYVEIARTLFDRSLHSQISEWEPFYILGPSWPYIILWMSGFWLFSRKKISHWLRFDTLLLVAGFSSSRNIPLFIVASLGNTDAYLKKALGMIPKRLDWPRKLVLGGLAIAVVISVGYGLKATYWPFAPRESAYPVQAVAYLQTNACPGNLFNDYNYGGYLIWKLPSEPVYIDGRMPSWRAPDGIKYLDTYLQVIKNKTVRQQQFTKYNIRCALLRNTVTELKMAKQLKSIGWRQVVQTNGSTLLIKR